MTSILPLRTSHSSPCNAAAETGHTLAQVALAWIAAKITAPIASATSVAQIEELLGAMNLELSDEQVAILDAASAS